MALVDFVFVPEGRTLLGLSAAKGLRQNTKLYDLFSDRVLALNPKRECTVAEFRIARYPVLQKEFLDWALERTVRTKVLTSGRVSYWQTFAASASFEPFAPVFGVSWLEATAFASDHGARLPSEEEWVRAARGDEVGDAPDDLEGIFWLPEADLEEYSNPPVVPCTRLFAWKSWAGAVDMLGNVAELTSSTRSTKGSDSWRTVMQTGSLAPVLAWGYADLFWVPNAKWPQRFRHLATHHGFRMAI
jgi:formylglycine-generating enzyme required for sulfatase activity